MSKFKLFFSGAFILVLAVFFWRTLFYSSHETYHSSLIGNPIPQFSLPVIAGDKAKITAKDLYGELAILHFWSTWCYACELEHPVWLKIQKDYHIPIYGFLYRDDKKTAIDWLKIHGNPFNYLLDDVSGDAAIAFGIFGTPETYLIEKSGKIVYSYRGVVNEAIWENEFLPLILARLTHA